MPAISVIIPAHNIEKYIVRCLDSISRQTFTDFECIIVENASSDSTLDVIRKYIKDKAQFKLISVKEAGVSNARNIGISASIADYITFIDGDDYVSENYLQMMFAGMTEHKADMVVLPFYYDTGVDIKCHRTPFPVGIYGIGDLNNINTFNCLCDFFLTAWNHLYKLSIIRDNNICFDTDLRYYEDQVFTHQYINYCTNIVFVDGEVAYYYFVGRKDNACSVVSSSLLLEQELQAYRKITTTCNNIRGGGLAAYIQYLPKHF